MDMTPPGGWGFHSGIKRSGFFASWLERDCMSLRAAPPILMASLQGPDRFLQPGRHRTVLLLPEWLSGRLRAHPFQSGIHDLSGRSGLSI